MKRTVKTKGRAELKVSSDNLAIAMFIKRSAQFRKLRNGPHKRRNE